MVKFQHPTERIMSSIMTYLMCMMSVGIVFFFSSRRRHTRFKCDWSSDVCSSDLSCPAVVHHVCQDMSAAYTKGVGLALPAAAISYDRFHVVKMAIEAMDEVRRTEWRDQPHAVHAALGGTDRKVLKGLMWGMRKNPPAWSG